MLSHEQLLSDFWLNAAAGAVEHYIKVSLHIKNMIVAMKFKQYFR